MYGDCFFFTTCFAATMTDNIAQAIMRLIASLLPASEQYIYTQRVKKIDLISYMGVKIQIGLRLQWDPLMKKRIQHVVGITAVESFVKSAEALWMKDSMLITTCLFYIILYCLFSYLTEF